MLNWRLNYLHISICLCVRRYRMHRADLELTCRCACVCFGSWTRATFNLSFRYAYIWTARSIVIHPFVYLCHFFSVVFATAAAAAAFVFDVLLAVSHSIIFVWMWFLSVRLMIFRFEVWIYGFSQLSTRITICNNKSSKRWLFFNYFILISLRMCSMPIHIACACVPFSFFYFLAYFVAL